MDNIRAAINIVFNHTSPEFVLDKLNPISSDTVSGNDIVSERIDEVWFCAHLGNRYPRFTNNQAESIYRLLESQWLYNPNNKEKKKDKGKSIFNIPLYFVNEVLVENNEFPNIKYKELFRWRELSLLVGEDFLTTSYFAKKDIDSNSERSFFCWFPIISHDNNSIHNITEKGLTELHYHLFGSSLIFDLNWLSLMNDVAKREKGFSKLKVLQNLTVSSSAKEYKRTSLYELFLVAAKIRSILFECIILGDDKCEYINDFDNISIKTLEIQKNIEALRYSYGLRYKDSVIDYAINLSEKEFENGFFINSILSGERRILYKTFKYIYSKNENCEIYSNYLFLYILIKNKIRKEFIQTNNKVGFENFSIYQDRKVFFLKQGSVYEKIMAELAVKSSFASKNLKYLEARITPKDTGDKLKKWVEFIDKGVINENMQCAFPYDSSYFKVNSDISKSNYGYVIHFLKKKDNNRSDNDFYSRNHKLRLDTKRQAIAINNFRNSGSKIASRIWGIDAASSEMNSRPEVFAQAMRYLKSKSITNNNPHLVSLTVPKLGFTYHVGEDNMDIVDGLRAIEEVLYFLNFNIGDRFGHALVVGVDVKEYYKRRNNYALMKKGELLDNLVWLRHKSIELNIHFPLFCFEKIRELSVEIYKNKLNNNIIDADLLYDAWLLRGDDPELYRGGHSEKDSYIDSYDRYGCNKYSVCNIARKNADACVLYSLYHFDKDVKKKCKESVEFKIDNEFISLVTCVQKNIRQKIVDKGIYIETNPSSNYKIGEIEKYSEHPIISYYNIGLTNDVNDLQMCVSINTDDLGVFSTTLENEYALLALALEKEKNDDGTQKYQPRMIYDWLNRIREQGFEQRFYKNNNL